MELGTFHTVALKEFEEESFVKDGLGGEDTVLHNYESGVKVVLSNLIIVLGNIIVFNV